MIPAPQEDPVSHQAPQAPRPFSAGPRRAGRPIALTRRHLLSAQTLSFSRVVKVRVAPRTHQREQLEPPVARVSCVSPHASRRRSPLGCLRRSQLWALPPALLRLPLLRRAGAHGARRLSRAASSPDGGYISSPHLHRGSRLYCPVRASQSQPVSSACCNRPLVACALPVAPGTPAQPHPPRLPRPEPLQELRQSHRDSEGLNRLAIPELSVVGSGADATQLNSCGWSAMEIGRAARACGSSIRLRTPRNAPTVGSSETAASTRGRGTC